MKTTNRETIKLTVNILIRKFCEDKAAKNFSMSKKEAEDYGACEETSLREEDRDKLFEDFALDCFTRPSFSNNGERYERKIQCIRSLRLPTTSLKR